jgi:hypothetical protein
MEAAKAQNWAAEPQGKRTVIILKSPTIVIANLRY